MRRISWATSFKESYPQEVAPYFTPSLIVPHLSEPGQEIEELLNGGRGGGISSE